jgi:hypothetical protein
MTSRRGTVIEQGASELLQTHGYTVRIIPCGFDQRAPPAHLVASKAGGTRFIRIRKISRLPVSAVTVESRFNRDIVLFRKYLARHPGETGLSCEVWTYSLTHGFRSFGVSPDVIREIPKFAVTQSPSDIEGIV